MKTTWRTLWQQRDIVVFRDEVEVDRIGADSIERVFFLYDGAGDTPGDIGTTVVETSGGYAWFEAETGFAGRVNFERQAFWRQRACVYWVAAAEAALPWRLRMRGLGGAGRAAYRTLSRAELDDSVARWPTEGPQTWDERKLRRIERSRPFGFTAALQA